MSVQDCIKNKFLKIKTKILLFFIRDEDERRLHDLASKTKTIMKELAGEINTRKNNLSKVIH